MRTRLSWAMVSVAILAACQQRTPEQTAMLSHTQAAPADPIAEAMSAAPTEIARDATIMDWPHTEGGEMVQLRAGTNDWVCYPSSPQAIGANESDPMCLDPTWQEYVGAWISRTRPTIRNIGIGYMLQGDAGVSNTDPYATGPTSDNEWVRTGSHIMIVVPDVRSLDGMAHDPATGGPYVMWRGTPYAHIMVPVPGN
jgi:hypothetical protein